MSSNGCNHDVCLISEVGGSVVHGDAECPVIRARQFLVSQTWMGGIGGEPFQLLPEFQSNFFGQAVQLSKDGLGNDEVNRQSVFGPLSRI